MAVIQPFPQKGNIALKPKRQNRKTAYNREEAGRRYGEWLSLNRRRRAITREQLSEGLCTVSMLCAIENGKKNPGRLLRERLFLRVGISGESYESHLGCEEYAEWELQQKILTALNQNDISGMTDFLMLYSKKYSMESENAATSTAALKKNRKAYLKMGEQLRKQFYFQMKGLCLKRQGAAREELSRLFGDAVRLTVPAFDEKPLRQLVLASQEIDLILEYIDCLPLPRAVAKFRELLIYLKNYPAEDDSRVVNYPKTVLLLCRALQKQNGRNIQNFIELIKLCNSAIMLLRDTKRLYYLSELLALKAEVIEGLQKLYRGQQEPKRAGALSGMLEETQNLRQLFEDLYERFGMPRNQWRDGYLYCTQDVYCIGDIVRIRRKMLKMTQEKLCEEICSLDTLRRLEGKKKTTQPAILWALCERLRLSPECEQTELVTANPQARLLEKTIRRLGNSYLHEEILSRLEELKQLIDTEHPINRQWLLYTEGFTKYCLGQLNREEYRKWLVQSLECTLPLSILELPDEEECYLTNSEMACIYHLALRDTEEDLEKAYNRMRLVYRVEEEFEKQGRVKNHICTYELYIKHKTKLLYAKKSYDLSCCYIKKIIQFCLNAGRMNMLDSLLYNWICNTRACALKGTPDFSDYDWKKDLKQCLMLSRFCRNTVTEKFYNMLWEQKDKY